MKYINIIKISVLFFILVSFNGCKDEDISLTKSPYYGADLKIDGYYYVQDVEQNFTNVFFLYRDGIILHTYGYSSLDLNIVEQEIIERYSIIKDTKDCWGVFIITGNAIEYEKWGPSVGGGLPTYKCIGEILNDTTFIITESVEDNKTSYKDPIDVYHYKHFLPKLDSTNIWIK